MSEDELLQASRETIARGSRSFAAASRLLPDPVRDSAHLLYMWCRHCDDCIDAQHLGFADSKRQPSSLEVLEYLTDQTRKALAGESVAEAPFVALSRLARLHDMPPAYPLSHLDGFAMDVRGASYQTIDDTIRYSYHVAGVVGVMMAHIMGVRDRDTLDRAADLGIAFQLTNIARDVIEDASVGRVYLPREWLDEHQIEPERIAVPANRAALAQVIGKLLDEAECYYDSANVGIARLPLRFAWSIAAARLVYRDIGHLIRRRGRNAWDQRASLSPARRLELMAVGAVNAATLIATRNHTAPARSGLWPIPRETD